MDEATLSFFEKPPQKYTIPEDMFKSLAYKADAETVPALYQHNYYHWYYLIAKYFRPNSLLEIGTRFGYSLIAMCQGSPGMRVKSIDLESYEQKFSLTSQEVAKANLAACATVSEVEFIVGDSHKVEVIEYYDMVHIDGDHSEEGAYEDIIKYYNKLKFLGIILVDDLDDVNVYAAYRKALRKLNYCDDAFCPTKHGMGIIRRG